MGPAPRGELAGEGDRLVLADELEDGPAGGGGGELQHALRLAAEQQRRFAERRVEAQRELERPGGKQRAALHRDGPSGREAIAVPRGRLGRFVAGLEGVVEQRQLDELLQLRGEERPLLDLLLDLGGDDAVGSDASQRAVQPLLQEGLARLLHDAHAVEERLVGGLVDDERAARQQRHPLRRDPLEERAERRAPRLRGEERGNRQQRAQLRVHAEVPVGVEVEAAAAPTALAVLRQRQQAKRLAEVRLDRLAPGGQRVEQTRLQPLLELPVGALEENHLEDLPAAREEGGVFGQLVEKRRLEQEVDQDFAREDRHDLRY